MRKLMPIYRCYKCINCSTIDCRNHFCIANNTRKKIKTNIFTGIPDWCPLEDVPNKDGRLNNGS